MKIKHSESEYGKQQRKLMIVTNGRTDSNQDDIIFDDELKSQNGLNWEDVEDDEETNDENEYKSYKIKYYSNSD